jgi:hypothetical protein
MEVRVRGAGMPINRLPKDGKVTPEEAQVLSRAFDLALRLLHLLDRNDPLSELVAKKIIEIGATGVRDASKISTMAVKQLGLSA